MISYQGMWLTRVSPFRAGKVKKAEQQDQTHEHRQSDLLHGGKEHGVNDAIEENSTISQRMTSFGMPSQTRVLDSRSYFFMTASTSAAVPTDVSCSSKGGRRCLLRLFLFEQSHWVFPLISDVVLSRSPAGH